MSLTRGRLGWAELCRPTGGAAHWRPDSGSAEPPLRRTVLWARGGGAAGSREVRRLQSPPPCRPVCSLHRLLCPALAGRSSCCNNTRSISGSPPAPASSLLSPGVSSALCVVGQVPSGDSGAGSWRAGSGGPFHLIAGLHLLFMPWTHFWWSGERAFSQNNVFKYIFKSTWK